MNGFDSDETTPPEVIGEQIAAIGSLLFVVSGLIATAIYFLTR